MKIFGRIIFFLGAAYIVGHSVIFSIMNNDIVMALFKFLFFPLTYFIWPWYSGLWVIFLVSLVGYWISTFGGMDPVD